MFLPIKYYFTTSQESNRYSTLSEHAASTVPQGSIMSEWPNDVLLGLWRPIWAAAIT